MKKVLVLLIFIGLGTQSDFAVRAQQSVRGFPWERRDERLLHMGLLVPEDQPRDREGLFAYTMASARFSPEMALSSIEDFVRSYPQDARREQLYLYKGAIYLHKGDFNRARYYLEQVDEGSLTGDALAEWKVRTAYALVKTNRNTGGLRLLFESAAVSDGFWGNVAKLYLAGEILAEGQIPEARKIYRSLSGDKDLALEAGVGMVSTFYYEGKYSETVAEGERLARIHPDVGNLPVFLRTMGNACYRLGKASEAKKYHIPLFRRFEELVTPEDRLLFGAALIEEEHYAYAQNVLRPATTDKTPIGQVATLYLSRALREEGRFPDAIASYESLVGSNPDPAIKETAMYEMALVMRASGQSNFGQDVRIAEDFLTLFPRSKYRDTMERFLVEFYLSNSDFAYSLESIRRLPEKTEPIREAEQYVLNHLAKKATEEGALALAEEYLALAMAKPRVSQRYYGESLILSSLLQEKKGNYSLAARDLRAFLALPAGFSGGNLPEAYYRLGYIYFNNRDFDEAVTSFNQYLARSVDPGNDRKSDTHARLGDCYFAEGNLDEALIAYDLAARSVSPKNRYALSRKAEILGIRKQYRMQIATLDEIIAIGGGDAPYRRAALSKGTALQMAGDYTHAEEVFKSVGDSYSNSDEGREASLRLALLYYNTNRTEAAIDRYNRLIATAPQSKEARQAFENLKKIGLEEGRMDIVQQAVTQSKGLFRLSDGETREMNYEIAKNAYTRGASNAEESLKNFLASYPEGADATEIRLLLADIYMKEGNGHDAYLEYRHLEGHGNQLSSQQKAVIFHQMGILETQNEAYPEAFEHFRLSFHESEDPRSKASVALEALRVANRGHLTSEGLDFAEEVLALSEIPSRNELLLQRGYLYLQAEKADPALQDFEAVAKSGEKCAPEGTVAFAETLFRKKGDAQKARERLSNFVKAGSPDEYWLARAYLLLAEIFQSEGDDVTALQYLKSLEKNYPRRSDDIHARISQILQNLNPEDAASDEQPKPDFQ